MTFTQHTEAVEKLPQRKNTTDKEVARWRRCGAEDAKLVKARCTGYRVAETRSMVLSRAGEMAWHEYVLGFRLEYGADLPALLDRELANG